MRKRVDPKLTPWEEKIAHERERVAKIRRGKKKMCPTCGLYGCVCQLALNEFIKRN